MHQREKDVREEDGRVTIPSSGDQNFAEEAAPVPQEGEGVPDRAGSTPFRQKAAISARLLADLEDAEAARKPRNGCQMAISIFLDCLALRTMAPLRYAAKFDPFLSFLGKKGIKFYHLATLQARVRAPRASSARDCS